MTAAMSVGISLMQVPSGIGGSAATIAFATWTSKAWVSHQPLELGRLWNFLSTVPLPPVWCGPAWDADFRVHEIVIRFWCLQRGPAGINEADPSAVCLLCHDVVQTCLSLAAVGASERVGHATFWGVKESVQKRELVVLCQT